MKREKQISYNRPDAVEVLPESPELEKAVLGALVLESDQLPDVAEIVEISAFHTPNNGKIYGVMLSMLERGNKIDLYTLADRPELKGREMLRYLSELTNAVDSGVNVLDHARQLANTEIRRRMCLFGYELSARAVSDPDGVVDWATSEITAIADRAVRSDDITPLSDVVRATLDDLERRQQARQEGECIGISTGLQRLDALTGGWRGGQLVVLAGRPGTGKSATMLHFARAAAIAGVSACVFSLEMPAEQIMMRMLASLSRVDQTKIRTGQLDDEDWARISSTMGILMEKKNMYIDDSSGLTPTEVRSRARRIAREHGGLSLIMVDYLQLMRVPALTDNRTLEIAEISRSLKALAKELNVPVVALSQLNRSLEQRADKRPVNSDLRESGSIEQDADLIMFIYRDEVYHPDSPLKGTAEIIIGKQRNGPIGSVRLTFQGNYSRFDNYAGPAFDDE